MEYPENRLMAFVSSVIDGIRSRYIWRESRRIKRRERRRKRRAEKMMQGLVLYLENHSGDGSLVMDIGDIGPCGCVVFVRGLDGFCFTIDLSFDHGRLFIKIPGTSELFSAKRRKEAVKAVDRLVAENEA